MVSRTHFSPVKILNNEYAAFNKEVIKWAAEHVIPHSRSFMDPFAGSARLLPYVLASGTTAYFNDILPIHKVINEAKLPSVYRYVLSLSRTPWNALVKQTREFLAPIDHCNLAISSSWMTEDTLSRFTSLWFAASRFARSKQSLYKAILLLLVRPYSGVTPSKTNSTWLKPGGISTEIPAYILSEVYVHRFRRYFEEFYGENPTIDDVNISFVTDSALQFMSHKRVSTIFTSPPFPNRFDYTRMYAPELAFLSHVVKDCPFNFQPSQLLGTNMVKDYHSFDHDLDFVMARSRKVARFLRTLRKRSPQQESDYYAKYFTRYYFGLFRFVDTAMKTLGKDGVLYLALQDNIHRGIKNRLAAHVIDFAHSSNYDAGIVSEYERRHQGKRHVSSRYPLIVDEHKEHVVRIGVA